MKTLRDYQEEEVDAVWTELIQKDKRSTLGVAATGLGKTTCAAFVARHWPRERGRILFLAHLQTLVDQAVTEFKECCPDDEIEVEMGPATVTHELNNLYDVSLPRIVIGSKDSLCQPRRLSRWDPASVGLIIIDEGHHYVPSNTSYSSIVNYFPNAKILGLTATADRSDGIGLWQSYESVAFRHDIVFGIENGWLTPIDQRFVTVKDYDLSRVRVREGDFDPVQLDEVLRQEKVMQGMVDPMLRRATESGLHEPSLVFAPSVEAAKAFARVANRPGNMPGSAVALWGEIDPDMRRTQLERFKRGEFFLLFNYGLFIEGANFPFVKNIFVARPTLSRKTYAQMLGRGLRVREEIARELYKLRTAAERRAMIAADDKNCCRVYDFVGNSGRHKLITSIDILAGDMDNRVAELAKNKLAIPGGGDAMDAINASLREIEELEAKEEEKRKGIIIRAKTSERFVDPFIVSDTVPAVRSIGKADPIRPGQRDYLRSVGYTDNKWLDGLSRKQAGAIINKIRKKRNDGPATPGMQRVLEAHGYPVDMTFGQAQETIKALEKNGWKRPVETTADESV